MKLFGSEWAEIPPVYVLQDSYGEIEIVADSSRILEAIPKYEAAQSALLTALARGKLRAQLGGGLEISPLYWETGSANEAISGGYIPSDVALALRLPQPGDAPFFVDADRFAAWLGRPSHSTQSASPVASENESPMPPVSEPGSSQGASTKREQRTKDKQEMYKIWYGMVPAYGCKEDGGLRSRTEIAKKIAKDPKARDPFTGKPPAPTTVIRRLNKDYPGWVEKRAEPKVGQ